MSERRRIGTPIMTAALALLTLLSLTAAVSAGWFRSWVVGDPFGSKPSEAWFRILCLAMAGVLGTVLYFRLRTTLSLRPPTEDAIFQPQGRWLRDLQRDTASWLGAHDAKAVVAFVEFLTNPARHRVRVSETVDFEPQGVHQQVVVEFDLCGPRLGGEYMYLPVLQPLKGELVDNFRMWDASGSAVGNLSYEETTRLAAAGLRLLLASGLDDAGRATKGENTDAVVEQVIEAARLDRDTEALDFLLLEQVARRGRIDARKAEPEVDLILNELVTPENGELKERLRAYVLSLCVAYPIVAVVPAQQMVANRVLLKYARSQVPSALVKGTRGALRTGLGLRPHQIAIPVDLALTAGSYHLRINGPADKYAAEQHLRCKHCGIQATREWRGKEPDENAKVRCFHATGATTEDCHFRLRRRLGQSFVHLYMRGYGNAEVQLRGLQLLVRYKEVPPGSRAQAAMTAFATTVIVGAVGNMIARQQSGLDSDLATIMLALPAIAASWFGLSGEGRSFVGSSALARLSMLWSGVVSILAVVVFLVHDVPTRPRSSAPDPDRIRLSFIGLSDPLWVALMFFSLANFLYIFYRFALRLNYYNMLRQREDADSSDYGV